MKTILCNILALIIGLFAGAMVNMLIVMMGPHLIPPPEGVDMTQIESLNESAHLLGPRHFIFPFIAHAGGTLAGACISILIAGSYRRVFAYTVGVFFLAGGIAAATMIDGPLWFNLLDLGGAYLPMAWLATYLLREKVGAK